MPRPTLRLLPICLAAAFAAQAQEPAPPTWVLCPSPETLPVFKPGLDKAAVREGAATEIQATDLHYIKDDTTVFSGNVELQRADQWLGTDKLTFEHDSEKYSTEGPVRYQDRGMRLTAGKAEGDQKADLMRLDDVQYQFEESLGNGVAATALMEGEQGRLDNATYSTCPPGQRQWEFSASEINVDQAKARGTARNAVLRLGKVPVLWLPFISFPTDDRRRSGLLAPTIGNDDENGFDLRIPVYLNLAPNYDATLTPRWLSRRGFMIGGEFRYLTENHRGRFDGNWLPDDDLNGLDRSLVQLDHFSRLNDHWYASAQIRDVSDVNYFEDFGESLATTSISLLNSNVGLYGRGRGWSASLSAERWQIANPLLPPGSEPYRRLPRAQFSWGKALAPSFEAGISAEAVHFDHEVLQGGRRIDLRPYVRLPLGGAAWFLTPELAWRHTSYSLDGPLAPGMDRSPTRSLPIASLDAGMVFERDFSWGGDSFLQTLEPRFYYLRVPYRDQSDLPLFDTQPLSFSWPGLFRDNRFGGADRQADANQATFAITTRVLSAADGRERLSASLGRVVYFDAPRVTLPGEPPRSDDGSAYVAELSLALSDDWSIGVAQQWEPESERTALSAVRSQWRFRGDGVVNAAYRYRAGLLEQTDLSFVVPVNDNWRLMGRWNYSLRDNQTLESLAGFEWKSCCMALRILGRQYVRSLDRQQNLGIYLELELNGIGSFGRDTARILDNAILGYSR